MTPEIRRVKLSDIVVPDEISRQRKLDRKLVEYYAAKWALVENATWGTEDAESIHYYTDQLEVWFCDQCIAYFCPPLGRIVFSVQHGDNGHFWYRDPVGLAILKEYQARTKRDVAARKKATREARAKLRIEGEEPL